MKKLRLFWLSMAFLFCGYGLQCAQESMPSFSLPRVNLPSLSKPTWLDRLKANIKSSPHVSTFTRTEDEAVQREIPQKPQPYAAFRRALQNPKYGGLSFKAATLAVVRRELEKESKGLADGAQESEGTSPADWRTRFAAFTERAKGAASGFGTRVKEGFTTPGGNINRLQKEKKELKREAEHDLAQARNTWNELNPQQNWWSYFKNGQVLRDIPHIGVMGRTPVEEKQFKAGEELLKEYDVIAKERALSAEEKNEVSAVTNKMVTISRGSEDVKVKHLTAQILKREATLKGRIATLKEDITDDALRAVVRELDLVGYVEGKIMKKLESLPLSQAKQKEIADELIRETGGATGTNVKRALLRTIGSVDDLQEQTEENIAWWVTNWADILAQELEKKDLPYAASALKNVPAHTKKIHTKVLNKVPDIRERLIPILAEELEKQKAAKASK